MALIAELNADFFHRTTGHEGITAGAGYLGVGNVVWVYIWSHIYSVIFSPKANPARLRRTEKSVIMLSEK